MEAAIVFSLQNHRISVLCHAHHSTPPASSSEALPLNPHDLDEIRTERAQAAVDHRRVLSAFADAVEGEAFDENKAATGAALRLQSAERLREAVVTALKELHKLLNREQRARLAYLIRTGTLSI